MTCLTNFSIPSQIAGIGPNTDARIGVAQDEIIV